EIHQRLRVRLDVLVGKQRFGATPERALDLGVARKTGDPGVSPQDAFDVAGQDRATGAEGKRGDRRGGRAADARQVSDCDGIARENTAVLGDERLRRAMEQVRAAVVPESAP